MRLIQANHLASFISACQAARKMTCTCGAGALARA